MPKERSKDIYETRWPHEQPQGFVRRGQRSIYFDLAKQARAWRRRTIMLTSLLFIVLAAIGVLSIISSRPHEINPPPSRPAASPKENILNVSRVSRIQITPEASLLIDELGNQPALEPPAEASAPFDTRWLKQAAYYLVTAEKAYRDDRMEDALRYFSNVLKIFPDLQGVQRYLGLIYLRLQDYSSAAVAFEKASRENAASAGVANNLGVAYLALKDYLRAEQYLKRALALKPDYDPAILNLATLYIRRNDKAQAAVYLSRYLQVKPGDIKAAQTYASILMDIGKWDQAVVWLKRVCDSVPSLAPAYFRLAQALAHTGHDQEAIATLRHGATLIDPRKALAWLSAGSFDPIRKHPDFQKLVSDLSAAGR